MFRGFGSKFAGIDWESVCIEAINNTHAFRAALTLIGKMSMPTLLFISLTLALAHGSGKFAQNLDGSRPLKQANFGHKILMSSNYTLDIVSLMFLKLLLRWLRCNV